MGIVQISSSVVSIQKGKGVVNVDLPVKLVGVDMYGSHFAVWGDGKVAIYQLGIGATNEKPTAVGIVVNQLPRFQSILHLFFN